MPAITGDPSVLLAEPPPDGGWTPRLDRTVTGQPSRYGHEEPGKSFVSGGHNGGQDALWKYLRPLYKTSYITCRYSPQGSLWRERPPKRGGEVVDFGVHHLPLPGAAPAAKNRGSLPPPSSPPCDAPGEAGTREAQPRFALLQPTRGIRANPPPIRLSRQGPDHSSEARPLREKRCGCQKREPPDAPPR